MKEGNQQVFATKFKLTEIPDPRPFAPLQRCVGAGGIVEVRVRPRPESAGQADKEGGDFAQLVAGLDSFFTYNGLYQKSDMDAVTAETIKAEDLCLVCYEYFCPSYAPYLGV